MAGQTTTVTMTGGGPWGFRLFGGDDDPLLVAKLRKRSKAHDSGLQEEDVILAINNFTTKGMDHSTAMGLTEKNDTLKFTVLRGTSAEKSTVDAAFQNLGPEYKPLPASEMPHPETLLLQVGQAPSGRSTSPRASPRGNVWKVKDLPPPEPVLLVNNVSTVQTKSSAWTPTVSGPSGVHVEQHSDQSVTMTIGVHKPEGVGKENVSPYHEPPMFKVAKLGGQHLEPNDMWKPSAFKQQQPNFPSSRREHHSPQPERSVVPDGSGRWNPPPGMGQPEPTSIKPSSLGNNFKNNAPLPLMLNKILIEGIGSGSEECSTPDTPTRKKKLFGDSAFYDDPHHKYPTIEEQVKMARNVALSLTAPVNEEARGHRMFVKRQKKSTKWTTTDQGEFVDSLLGGNNDEDDEMYSNPNPWKGKWEPNHITTVQFEIPQAPPLPVHKLMKAPNIPQVDKEKSNALSKDEIERMRLHDPKTAHTSVGPQACFALADALKHNTGKAGRLFSKGKERADKHSFDDDNVKSVPRPLDDEMIRKLTGGRPVGVLSPPAPAARPAPPAPVATGGHPVNRLKGMIEVPKAPMTPWDAAVQDPSGNLDQAFTHLEGYFEAKSKVRAANSLQGVMPAAPPPLPVLTHNTTSSTAGSGPSRMPDYTRKIKPWGGAGPEASSPAGSSSSQSWSGSHDSPAAPPPPTLPRPAAPSWAQQQSSPASSSTMSTNNNFRPVKFTPAPGVVQTGAWHPSSGAACHAASPVSSGGEAYMGACDL